MALLTGLIHCAKCGGAMTIRTGKGGRYCYYTCWMKARQGASACEGMTVPMEKLDDLVAEHLEERLLDPDRLEEVWPPSSIGGRSDPTGGGSILPN